MYEKPFDSQNAAYAQALYEEFARNPDSVPEEWQKFFALGPQVAVQAGLMVPEGLAENGGASPPPSANVTPTRAAGMNPDLVVEESPR